MGDVHGMAQTWGNLGSVYYRQGEWDRAIEMYEKSLETKERVRDVHGMAQTWINMAILYLDTGRPAEAKPLLARAYLILSQCGSPYADTAAQRLVEACGSVEAADDYLTQLVEEAPAQ